MILMKMLIDNKQITIIKILHACYDEEINKISHKDKQAMANLIKKRFVLWYQI